MTPAREQDRTTLVLIALFVGAALCSTSLATCDAREQRREAAAIRAAAQARAASAAIATTRLTSPGDEEQLRQKLTIEALQQQLAVQRSAFEDQREFSNSSSTMLGVLLALVGFLLPLWLYLTSIRPGEKVIEEARNLLGGGLDRRFEELLQKQRNAHLARALEQVRSSDQTERTTGAQYLAMNPEIELTDQQLFDLTEAARSNPLPIQSPIATALASRDSPYVTRLLSDLLTSAHPIFIMGPVIRHCTVASAEMLRQKLKAWLLTSTGIANAVQYLNYAASVAPTMLDEFIRDAAWLEKLPIRVRTQLITLLRASEQILGRSGNTPSSAVAASIVGVHYAPINGRMQDCEPADAVHILIFEDGAQKGVLVKGSQAFDDAMVSLLAKRAEMVRSADSASPSA